MIRQAGWRRRRPARPPVALSEFAGFRFPPEVIVVAVRWYLRYLLSYRDVEGLLAARGVNVDHVTIDRWVRRSTPLLIDAARPGRRTSDDRWFVDETYLKVAGRWTSRYRAVDQFGQVIDVLAADRRDLVAARWFFTRALSHDCRPVEVATDRAAAYPRVLDRLTPAAVHAFVQNIRRGHDELGVDAKPRDRLTAAFAELAVAI